MVDTNTFPEGLAQRDAHMGIQGWRLAHQELLNRQVEERGYQSYDDKFFFAAYQEISTMTCSHYAPVVEAAQKTPATSFSLLPAATFPGLETTAASMPFDGPQSALEYVLTNRAPMQRYYDALRVCTEYFGTQVQIRRPQANIELHWCKACGVWGHAGGKKCPSIIGKIQERKEKGKDGRRLTLGEHILKNVETFPEEHRTALLCMIRENEMETFSAVDAYHDLMRRRAEAGPDGTMAAPIVGPSPVYIGANPSADQRRKPEAPRATPALPTLLEGAEAPIPWPLRRMLGRLYDEIRAVEGHLATLERELEALAETDPVIPRLLTIPGIGLITATALVASVPHIHGFARGRRFASWLGLTPRAHSSGTRRRLGRITKAGDAYLRCLLTHGARSVLVQAQRRRRTGGSLSPLGQWALTVAARAGHNKATIAVANKLARMVWAVWRHDVPYIADVSRRRAA